MITESRLVELAVQEWGDRSYAGAARRYASDTRKLMQSPPLTDDGQDDAVRLQARIAFRFARLALED